MKILVIGGGGREHALCWSLHRSPLVEEIFCAPGNPGIAEVADCLPVGGLGHRRDRRPGGEAPRRPDGRRARSCRSRSGSRTSSSSASSRSSGPRGSRRRSSPRKSSRRSSSGATRSRPPTRRSASPPTRRGERSRSSASRSSSRPTVWPAGRAFSIIDSDGRGRAGAPPLLPGARLRRRRRPGARRGVPARTGGLVPGALRRRGLRPAADRPRLQEGLRRRPRAEHRRDGRALAGRRPERGERLAGPARTSSGRRFEASRPRGAVSGAFSTRG